MAKAKGDVPCDEAISSGEMLKARFDGSGRSVVQACQQAGCEKVTLREKVGRNEHIALVREHTKAAVAKTELDVLRADETITVGIERCK